MRASLQGAFLVFLATFTGSACQVLSGLDDLETRSDETAEDTGTSSSASSSSGGGSGGGGGSEVICDAPGQSCPAVLIEDTGSDVDMLALSGQFMFWGTRGNEADPPTGKIRTATLMNGFVDPQSIQNVQPDIRP